MATSLQGWPVDFRLLWGKLGMGPQYHTIITSPSGKDMQEVAQLLSDGKLKAVIDMKFPLEQAA